MRGGNAHNSGVVIRRNGGEKASESTKLAVWHLLRMPRYRVVVTRPRRRSRNESSTELELTTCLFVDVPTLTLQRVMVTRSGTSFWYFILVIQSCTTYDLLLYVLRILIKFGKPFN